jgi:hypothetical protein
MKVDRPGHAARVRVAKVLWWWGVALTLLWGSSPAAAASELQVGDPHVVEPDLSWVPGAADPAGIASDGVNWLALGLTHYDAGDAHHVRLHATRVSVEGVVLVPPGLVIADVVGSIIEVSISFDGTHYVVVWAEEPILPGPWTVRLQRIATDGTFSGESVTLGLVDNPSTGCLEVASGPDSALVTWCANQSGPTVTTVCSWVQVEGTTVVASDSMPIDGGIAGLAASGDSWLIVTSSGNVGISLIRIGSDGLALDDAPTPIADGHSPALAAAETGWVVIWEGAQPMFALVSPDGSVAVGPAPLPGVQAVDGGSIVRTSEGFVITAPHPGSIVASVFGQDLSQPPDTVTVATGSVYTLGPVKAAWGGSSVLLNWSDYLVSGGIWGSFAKRLSSEGAVLDDSEIAIGLRPNSQRAPAAAHGPGGWLVAWQDNGPYGSWDIYAQRLDEQGIPSSQDSIVLAGGGGA